MILAVNTSTIQFSIALLKENGTILAEYFTSAGSKNFGSFMPSIHYLLKTSKSNIQDIKALVVTTGPGSFTGLRVGLSAAKGMAQSLQIPIIGVSSLEAMANLLPYTAYPICPMIHSRKGEVFTALFNCCDDHKMVRIKEDTCLKFEDLSSFIEGPTLFLGNDFNKQEHVIREMLGRKALTAPAHLWNLKASSVGTLGLERFHRHNFDDLQDLVPSYLRPPDIRPNPFTKWTLTNDTRKI
ncbi:MAG: tRNA (adenosine(37)-N6)-threonylcarbamoyltransferase complex dimerization subunit type 1 TsaB [Deltaproteobacteria bacterium]|nr:tRNA (adenosine(37)-N6)-threonylcarbamoyltransferase complex dimerization subunit type 1 TsaB [Deltaproteobacteria bacterium]